MCNLYSITTNQAAIAALFRVVNRYVGNLAPMPGVFPDYPAPVVRNTDAGTEMALMRWACHQRPAQAGHPLPILFFAPVHGTRRSGRAATALRVETSAKGYLQPCPAQDGCLHNPESGHGQPVR
jgi:putative SOS response-associated peptidase YedK